MKFNEFKKLGIYNLAIAGAIGLVAFNLYYLHQMNKDENVISVLESKGFTEVEVKDYAWLCPKTTYIKKHFEAVDKDGNYVKGKICDGAMFSFSNILSTEVIEKKKNKM